MHQECIPSNDNVESSLNASSEEQADSDNGNAETNDNKNVEQNNDNGVHIPALQGLLRGLKAGNDSSNEIEPDSNDAYDIPDESDELSNEDLGCNEKVLISGTNEVDMTEAAKKLSKLLLAQTLTEKVEAAREGMKLLNLKGRSMDQ